MKNRYRITSAFALLALAVAATSIRAQSNYTPYAFTNFAGSPGLSGTNDGAGSTARFNIPGSVAVDGAGNLYVDDFGNHTIRKMTSAGVVTTLAGLGGTAGTNDGTGSAARFNGPATLDVNANGNVYVTDFYNHTIRLVTPAGVVTTLAGTAGVSGTNDGPGIAARFNNPIGIAVDNATNVYVSDTGNQTIRKITPGGAVTTLAGRAGFTGSADGSGSVARFRNPYGVALTTNGNVYVADTDNYTIRRITPVGTVTTLAGRTLSSGTANGTGNGARFRRPYSLAMDSAGNLYVADSENHRITKGTPLLQVDTGIGIRVSSGFFQMRLIGPSGSNAVVEASGDLATWTPVQTNALPQASLDVSLPLDTNQNQFFRARLIP